MNPDQADLFEICLLLQIEYTTITLQLEKVLYIG